MKLAKIVSSNSHIDYVARVVDDLDADFAPSAADYGFGQFVSIPLDDDAEAVGVIYDSRLVNPEYSSYGPRLSPRPTLSKFSPDYLNEQGVLLGILLLGISEAGINIQGVPRRVVPPGQDVIKMDAEAVIRFHQDEGGKLRVHYYPQIITHSGAFAVPLLDSIIAEIASGCSEEDRNRLNVLGKTLAWQGTFGGMKL
jgi:hypothetical protein